MNIPLTPHQVDAIRAEISRRQLDVLTQAEYDEAHPPIGMTPRAADEYFRAVRELQAMCKREMGRHVDSSRSA